MGKFKLGIIVDSLKMGMEKGIEESARLGADGIQIYVAAGECSLENMTKDKIKLYNDMISSNGLIVSALCGDFGGYGFANSEDNKWRIDKTKRIMDLGLELGTNIVTTHIGTVPDCDNEKRKIMLDACNEIGRYGDKTGAFLAIETGPEKADTLKKFLCDIDSGSVKVNLDPANLVMVSEEDPVYAVKILGEYIVHTHAKDGVRIKGSDLVAMKKRFPNAMFENRDFIEVALGTGDVLFKPYLKELEKVGFDGFLTIEREVGEFPRDDIKIAIEYLKQYISEV